ncbi:hypothetical protein EJ05DRAFT_497192 [Pseudovirgaria hyperparasitica]|uniref:Mediator of RNA polymerase II transcription subunit 21 n=1 Tax=Pseudovirgaria hyperparasitica TaxID=470096 RepID=A0A6A6WHR6_9PEZI|nr:uncharacterized protein EJ05DRAFT_497192 [Pseudovirgaria hyperparasitica]KAF2762338.1 hypothetical protein EJ05DRAFT_497192 [Pseudovirgaria hyperparasitica]
MADRLSQLQTCLDQLTIQMYSSLMYINTRAPYRAIDGQPDWDPLKEDEYAKQDTQTQSQTKLSKDPDSAEYDPEKPHPPEYFYASMRELSRDLVTKQQQIDFLIDVLPGIGQSEQQQKKRLEELEQQLVAMEEDRLASLKEKDRLLEKLDEVVSKVKRI